MFRFGDEKGQLEVHFCGKSQEQVRKLIAGGLCLHLRMSASNSATESSRKSSQERRRESPAAETFRSPKRINHILNQYVIGQERRRSRSRSPSTITTSA